MVVLANGEEHPFSFALLCEANSVKNGLTTYVDLSHEVEAMLVERENEIASRAEAALKDAPLSEHQDIAEDHGLEIHPYQSVFPFLHRESMFITLYSYFEHVLHRLSEWVGEEIKSRVRPKDVHGKGIERSLLFLKLVPEFQFTRIPEVMVEIRGASRLRNTIVHAGTVLPENPNDALNQFVAAHPNLSGQPGRPVSLSQDFVSNFANTLTQFLTEFEAEMQCYMDRTWRKRSE